MSFAETLSGMRAYYQSGVTRSVEARRSALMRLRTVVEQYEQEIAEALAQDLGKPLEEGWVAENGMILTEIRYLNRHLDRLMKPRRVSTNLLNLPSRSRIIPEPWGVVLIIGPWNYPFHLLLKPLAGALAAGNVVVLKSSEFAPASSALMARMIREAFDPRQVILLEGEGATVVPALMDSFRFDHIFFTGSPTVGKLVYGAAARQLIPVTLELGGKSPCVVEAGARLDVAARRILLAKFSNCGQTCVAPDYLLVQEDISERFQQVLVSTLRDFFGEDPLRSRQYGKIVNEKQFDRLVSYLTEGRPLTGGTYDRPQRYIAPTILTGVSPDARVMNEEIFGPVLPVLTYRNREEALHLIRKHPDPLAFYVFTSDASSEKRWMEEVPFGGGCVNNCTLHLTNPSLPLGGRGNSGFGRYQGAYSFEAFSHLKSVMRSPFWFDPSIKYPPFTGKLGWFKKIIG